MIQELTKQQFTKSWYILFKYIINLIQEHSSKKKTSIRKLTTQLNQN